MQTVIEITNGTQDNLVVVVDYDYRCAGDETGRTSTRRAVMSGLRNQIVGTCASGYQWVKVLNYRAERGAPTADTDFNSNTREAEHQELLERNQRISNQERVGAEQYQQELARNRRVTCRIDEQGSFVLAEIAYGQVQRKCYIWFPELKAAAERYKQEEREKVVAGQKRMSDFRRDQEAKAESRKMDAMRKTLQAQQQADVQERKRKQAEARRREEGLRADQERSERESQEVNERAARYRADPCGAVTEQRAIPPTLSAYPAGASAMVRAGVDRYNGQLMDQWRFAIIERDKLCVAQGQSERTAQPQAIAEAARREQSIAKARADLDRVNAEGRQTLHKETKKTKALADQNVELMELLKGK